MPRERDADRDRAYFTRLVRGDRAALADLYDAHAARLFRHAIALTRRRPDAEDLVQAVFVRLATTGAPLIAVREPAHYLHRMLRTAWIDGARRRVARIEEHPEPDTIHDAPGRDEATEAAIDAAALVAQLPAHQREIVCLHLVEGFSFREAARITGVPTFTAASRYRTALKRLKALVGQP